MDKCLVDIRIAAPIWPTPLTNVPCCGTCSWFDDLTRIACALRIENGKELYYGGEKDNPEVKRHYICGNFKPIHPGDFNWKTRKWDRAQPILPNNDYINYKHSPEWVRS